ncbi:MAG: hypothetical protein C0483_18080 [Pirellula sp.]|nr:hypothetical protein [Pirellula sp.]
MTADASNSKTFAPTRSRCRRWLRRILLVALVPVIGAGAYVGFYHYHLKRFAVLDDGVFYRVAQPTEVGFQVLQKRYGAKTVVSLQLFDFRLHRGLFDPGRGDGSKETEYVERLGMKHVQWTMGDEQCWPWLDPYQLEAFYRLVDDPGNHPIVIHCMGGRHRTGTLSALYRLEYDRWPVDAALSEMYAFDFGHPISTQEHNLRAYVPRPEPSAEEWRSLEAAFSHCFSEAPPKTYRQLIRCIRDAAPTDEVHGVVREYVAESRDFALPLADRLIESPEAPLAHVAAESAGRTLDEVSRSGTVGSTVDLRAAVALIADYGTPAAQQRLADLVRAEAEKSEVPSLIYESIVSGLMNRYTRNRIAYLQPVVEDVRLRIGRDVAEYRYCDSAVFFVATITDQFPLLSWANEKQLSQGQVALRRWFTENASGLKLAQRVVPQMRYGVRRGDGPVEEDLSKMRR